MTRKSHVDRGVCQKGRSPCKNLPPPLHMQPQSMFSSPSYRHQVMHVELRSNHNFCAHIKCAEISAGEKKKEKEKTSALISALGFALITPDTSHRKTPAVTPQHARSALTARHTSREVLHVLNSAVNTTSGVFTTLLYTPKSHRHQPLQLAPHQLRYL